MKCPRCGADAGAGRFCSQCGAALASTGAASVPAFEEPTVVGAASDARRASAEDRTLVETPLPGGGSGAGSAASAGADAAAGGGAKAGALDASLGAAGATSAVDARIIGRKIGAVRILQRLGAGGMGVVYKGRHENLEKDVAIKVLPESFVSDAGLLERFRREARAAARVDHPNIVHIYDLGEEDGRAFILQEYVDGVPLDRLLKEEGAQPIGRALDLARGIAAALAAAHEAGLIHRDIKPSNVMITRSGEPKVLDFGLAKVVAGGAEAGKLSMTGQVLGTPFYMSPEQCQGKKNVDGRSDLYSLGATLYELLTGRRPFEADSVHGILLAHLTEPPPDLALARPGVPEAVRAIVARLLAKRPEDRFASGRELCAALDAARAALPSSGAATSDLLPPVAPPVAPASSLAHSLAGGTPRPIIVTPLSPPLGTGAPPIAPPVAPPPPPPPPPPVAPATPTPSWLYKNPLSWLFGHGMLTASLLLFGSLAAGIYVAERDVTLMRGWIYLALFPGIACVAAVFSPRVGAPLAAALFPTALFTGAFYGLVPAQLNETDTLVLVGVETGILLVGTVILHVISRSFGGPHLVPLLLLATIGLGIGVAVQKIDESPFDRQVGDVLVKRAHALETSEPAEALRLYTLAIPRQRHGWWYLGHDDARYRAARLHLDGESWPFDAAEGERLLEEMGRDDGRRMPPEARGFAVGYFAAKGEPARALAFIPEGTPDQMSVGIDVDADDLATLYLAVWRACRAQGRADVANAVYQRGAMVSPEFRDAADAEAGASPRSGFPGGPVTGPTSHDPSRNRVLKSWDELQKIMRKRKLIGEDGLPTTPLVPPPVPPEKSDGAYGTDDDDKGGKLVDPYGGRKGGKR